MVLGFYRGVGEWVRVVLGFYRGVGEWVRDKEGGFFGREKERAADLSALLFVFYVKVVLTRCLSF